MLPSEMFARIKEVFDKYGIGHLYKRTVKPTEEMVWIEKFFKGAFANFSIWYHDAPFEYWENLRTTNPEFCDLIELRKREARMRREWRDLYNEHFKPKNGTKGTVNTEIQSEEMHTTTNSDIAELDGAVPQETCNRSDSV